MENKNLLGRKLICIDEGIHESYLSKGISYEVLEVNDNFFSILQDDGVIGMFSKNYINKIFILLNEEKWIPKQGEKVFAGTDTNECIETTYVSTFNGLHYTTSGNFIRVEPYKEEIKVGDWVFRKTDTPAIFRYEKGFEDLFDLVKIKDKELIEKLNEITK